MDAMSNDDVRRIIEDATKESLRQSFTEAGRKFAQAAEISEQNGDYAGAEKLYAQAADTYGKAAERYRSSKSFKSAALNMCAAGDLYSELADSGKAVTSYQGAASDLLKAADEHLMWGEPSGMKRGTALAIAACMIYLMIGRENDAFQKARSFAAQNASKMITQDVVRLSQVPQQLEAAIKNLDIEGFSGAETVAVSELKPALVDAGAQEFSKYVDKGLDMTREILRGKLKIPKVITQLEIPIDVTFTEQFRIRVVFQNKGEGAAQKLNAEWFIDEGLTFVSGDKKKHIPSVGAGQSNSMEAVLRSSEELMGVKEFSILVRGTYTDKLGTEYSLQAGPGVLILKDYKEAEKLLHDLDVTDGRVSLLGSSIDESTLEKEPLKRIASGLTSSLDKARTDVEERRFEIAKARISLANDIVDTIDAMLGDEGLLKAVEASRQEEMRDYVKSKLQPIRQTLPSVLAGQEKKLKSEEAMATAEWEKESKSKRDFAAAVSLARDQLSDISRDIEAVYNQMPTAGASVSPTEAAARTKIRSSLDTTKTKTSKARAQLESLLSHEALKTADRRAALARVEMAQIVARSIISELAALLDAKLSELG
jgi:tetratricopeptide (TPR) repeat protein